MRRKPSDSLNNHLIVSTSHHPLGIYNSAVSGLWIGYKLFREIRGLCGMGAMHVRGYENAGQVTGSITEQRT